MPAGKVHTVINLGVFTLGTAAFCVLKPPVPLAETAVFAFTYLIGTLLITPDLDLADHQRVVAKRNWGPLGWLWVPYGKLSRHRGRSHTYLFGPVTRLLYLAAMLTLLLGVPWVLWNVLHHSLPVLPSWQHALNTMTVLAARTTLLRLMLSAILGYLISQWMHLVADGIFPWTPATTKRSAT